ncbi:MAG: hybrid sensor histidine kinase/response regulator [Candidatus Riflebacteria bacterium]|nr:hybrid sensor histidine kinase/response regulator [Candidatus Riflebacteria bacterium]
MDLKDAEFLKKLQGIFKIEAEEHIRAITDGLLDLENSPSPEKQSEIIETVFRQVHSLKGSARSVDLKEIESICHPMETIFSALKRKEVALTPQMFDLFHRCVDFISSLVSAPGTKLTMQNRAHARKLIKQMDCAAKGETSPSEEDDSPGETHAEPQMFSAEALSPSAEDEGFVSASPVVMEAKQHLVETVRIPTSKLDPLLYQAEEMILAKLAGTQRTEDLQEILIQMTAWKTKSGKWKKRLSAAKEQQFHEFFEWNNSYIHSLQSQVLAVTHAMKQDQRGLRRMVDEHLEAMKQVLMLPISVLTESFPKIVRDLSHDQAKEVNLVLAGGTTEIDRRILEDLKAPLIHLLRNCIDHGMQKPQDRVARNKSRHGTIEVKFTAIENHQVEIIIADDGEGIDIDRVRTAAVKTGVISSDDAERLSREETLILIYSSGVSSSPIITDISGRGLGMTIVRDKVEKLGGSISVKTESGLGTTFRIVVPLTLATSRGILVRVGESVFVLPSINVERVVRMHPGEIKTVENRETISLDNQILSIVKLSGALELPVLKHSPASHRTGDDIKQVHVCIVVLRLGETRLGFQVDEVIAEHQLLMKSLGKQLTRVRNIAGATILGNGKVVLVLNVPDLMKSAVRTVSDGKISEKEVLPKAIPGRILAADDSITARTFIRNILENAGYHVKSAVDGAEAFALAKSEDFDLIVSDVDMPHMNGFDLATRIRADKKLSEIPIVLVTALDSREDRERGIDVGANAYIVKSSFDQSNLLEVIHRLLY